MKNTNPAGALKGMDLLFSMLLFLVFVLSAVFTILVGSRVYENIRARNDVSFYSDTALGYITNKVRQADSSGAVSVQEVEGTNVLLLTTQAGDLTCETWIYTVDGQLMELFTIKDSGLSIKDGLPIMECQAVAFSLEEAANGSLLCINLESGSGLHSARLSLRSSDKGGVTQ